jgi:ankyrin repeat protein
MNLTRAEYDHRRRTLRRGEKAAKDSPFAFIRTLLEIGADPNPPVLDGFPQRGINDFTPLHMAVAERNLLAVQILLDAGSDPDLRTRIDDCETPLEMAESAGLEEFSVMLAPKVVRIDRHSLFNGLFYGIDGMRVGGTRRLEIAPHLAYGDRGVPGVIPAGAVLTAEITILEPRNYEDREGPEPS